MEHEGEQFDHKFIWFLAITQKCGQPAYLNDELQTNQLKKGVDDKHACDQTTKKN